MLFTAILNRQIVRFIGIMEGRNLSMFGISLNIWIKLDILGILDDSTDAISSLELTQQTRYKISQSTIKKLCRELQNDIAETFVPNEVTLIINKKGTKLVRHKHSYEEIRRKLFADELIFVLLRKLLLSRELETESFLKEHFISDSQLRRSIVRLNKDIEAYGAHISIGNSIKLTGVEHRIRTLYFILLFFIYGDIRKVPWIDQKEYFINQSAQIAEYMGWELEGNQLQQLAIWKFINHVSIAEQQDVNYSDEDAKILINVEVPPKPTFLDKWQTRDWQFFILSIYASDIIHFDLPSTHTTVLDIIANNSVIAWISTFEAYFAPLDDDAYEIIFHVFYRHLIASAIFKLTTQSLMLLPTVDDRPIEKYYPEYMSIFGQFWDAFNTQNTIFTGESFRQKSLLLCSHFVPFSGYLPQVSVYLCPIAGPIQNDFIKERIRSYFSNKFAVDFIASYEHADLILTTAQFPEVNLAEGQHFVVINSSISHLDFENMKAIMLEITTRKIR